MSSKYWKHNKTQTMGDLSKRGREVEKTLLLVMVVFSMFIFVVCMK